MGALLVKQIFDETKTKRLSFFTELGKPGFWWNYCDSAKTCRDDYQRCSDRTFETLAEAEVDAYKTHGF